MKGINQLLVINSIQSIALIPVICIHIAWELYAQNPDITGMLIVFNIFLPPQAELKIYLAITQKLTDKFVC